MKKGLFFLIAFITVQVFAQIQIKGKVLTYKNETLDGASVYLNNTTVGTTTNDKGEFELTIKEGSYELIVSFIGFKTAQLSIDTKQEYGNLIFRLVPETNMLDEVELKKTKYDSEWKYNLSRFKRHFFGGTIFAKDCQLLNPKVLHFEFDSKTLTLTVDAREPLQIKHKSLGYLITYDLVNFSLGQRKLIYLGYTKYQPLKGGKRKQRRWKKNRLTAYNGSRMHFVRSLRNKTLKKEGFVVNQFKRVPNPKRPTEEQIKKARQLVRLHRVVDFSKKITAPKTPLDSALVILRKVSLPKFEDFLYKRDVPYTDMMFAQDKQLYLQFKDYLSITYLNEPEEKNYLNGLFGRRKRATGVQTSAMTMLTKKAILDTTGEIINPLDVFVEGYWGFEQFANALPLDYQPTKD